MRLLEVVAPRGGYHREGGVRRKQVLACTQQGVFRQHDAQDLSLVSDACRELHHGTKVRSMCAIIDQKYVNQSAHPLP